MNPTFDLVDQPWIPCTNLQGKVIELGLRDTLTRAHELREISGDSPIVTVALHRLLLAILHRVYAGPTGRDHWAELWNEGQGRWDATKLAGYFAGQRTNFDLFHPTRPFYQAADERVKGKSVASMVMDVASGDNSTLFDHHTDAEGLELTCSQAARHLIAAQAFGLAGLSGPTTPNFTQAPCSSGITFLIKGETVFQTLMLNMFRYTDDTPIPKIREDLPAWEQSASSTSANRTMPNGYLDYLTWQNRRILLKPEILSNGDVVVRQMTMAPGLKFDTHVRDPMMHYIVENKSQKPFPLRFAEAKALWRDSSALFQIRMKGIYPPMAMDWLAELIYEEKVSSFITRQIMAMGLVTEKGKAGKVSFFRSERMPLRTEYLADKALVDALDDALKLAEDVARQLWGATRTLATILIAPESDLPEAHKPQAEDLNQLMGPWGVERRYWARLEAPFMATLAALPDDPAGAVKTWRTTLKQTAWQALNGIADSLGTAPNVLKASVQARGQLAAGLSKVFPA